MNTLNPKLNDSQSWQVVAVWRNKLRSIALNLKVKQLPFALATLGVSAFSIRQHRYTLQRRVALNSFAYA